MGSLVCVRHQASAPLGVIESVLDEAGVDWRYLDAWHEESPSVADISGLIVLGGEMNVDDFDRYPYLRSVRRLVEQAIGSDLPVLGVCLGGQTVARALGAKVQRAAQPEIGFHPIVPTEEGRTDPILGSFTGDFPVFQWHEDGFELPEEATLLHRASRGGNQAFRVGDSVYAVQFHFEVTADIISAWAEETEPGHLESYWGITQRELLQQVGDHLAGQKDAARAATKRFLELLA